MPEAASILERIDRAIAELQAIRSELAASTPAVSGNGLDVSDDFADANLVEVSYASERWNWPCDTLRLWCRQGDGKKVGGRWLISAPRIRAPD